MLCLKPGLFQRMDQEILERFVMVYFHSINNQHRLIASVKLAIEILSDVIPKMCKDRQGGFSGPSSCFFKDKYYIVFLMLSMKIARLTISMKFFSNDVAIKLSVIFKFIFSAHGSFQRADS